MTSILTYSIRKDMGWLRAGRKFGVAYKNTKVHPLLFSERTDLTKILRLGKWSFKILKPL